MKQEIKFWEIEKHIADLHHYNPYEFLLPIGVLPPNTDACLHVPMNANSIIAVIGNEEARKNTGQFLLKAIRKAYFNAGVSTLYVNTDYFKFRHLHNSDNYARIISDEGHAHDTNSSLQMLDDVCKLVYDSDFAGPAMVVMDSLEEFDDRRGARELYHAFNTLYSLCRLKKCITVLLCEGLEFAKPYVLESPTHYLLNSVDSDVLEWITGRNEENVPTAPTDDHEVLYLAPRRSTEPVLMIPYVDPGEAQEF